MIHPQEKDIGRAVRYRSNGGDKVEDGVITSISAMFVFVLYAGTSAPAATERSNLEWLAPSPDE